MESVRTSRNMDLYAVYSPSCKPVSLDLRCSNRLPHPFPSMVAVFALSSNAKPDGQDYTQKVIIMNQNDQTQCLEIGHLSQKNRAFCWQPCLNKEFTVPQGKHNCQLYIGTEAELKTIIPMFQKMRDISKDVADEGIIMESSQTESQEIVSYDMLPEGERPHNSAIPVSKSESKISPNEVTPQTQVQGTPGRPPSLSHSASKKRKAHHTDSDELTPATTRKRQSSRQRSSPSSLSSPLSTKTENARKKTQEKQTRITAPNSKRGSSDSEPSARWGHTLCDVGKQRSLLIGGQGYKQIISRDSIWMLDTEKSIWSTPPIVACSDKFPSRMGHTATFDPQIKCVFVFGGSKNLRWYSDIHVLDLDTWKWSLVEACGVAPTRAYHSSTIFRNELYIFGGVYPNPDPQPDGCSNDVFIFNPESESWYQPVTMGTKPKPRSGHSATLLGDKLVIFGGWDAPVCFNDLHILDLCLMEFTSPAVHGKPPSPRSWHASSALPDNRVLIHGGYNGSEALGDAFIFELDTLTWTHAQLKSSIPIGIRAGHTITCFHGNQESDEGKENDPCEYTLAIFGGGDNEDNFFDDLTPFTLS